MTDPIPPAAANHANHADATDSADTAHIADALKRLAAGRSLADSVVARLPIVDRRRRAAGLSPSATARDWAAGQVLADIVRTRLAKARGDEPSPTAGGPHDRAPTGHPNGHPNRDPRRDERERIAGDFTADSLTREAWSCLYYRFVHSPSWPVQQLADVVRPTTPHGKKLIVRRSALGFRLLAVALIDAGREGSEPSATAAASSDDADPRPGANPPPAGRRDPRTALEALRRHVVRHGLPTELPRDEAAAIAAVSPGDMDEYCLTRIAAWSRARYALDRRFVALSLLLDQGEEAAGGRWTRQPQRYDALAEALADVPDATLVLLGSPGCGKSTLLRRHELDLAVEAVRMAGHRGDRDVVGQRAGDVAGRTDPTTPTLPFYVELARFAPGPTADPPDPLAWLAAGWSARYPALPPLDRLLSDGRVVLLLDALNEMPHHSAHDFRQRIQAWRDALARIRQVHAGNRIVVSCRSLDYSASLSSDALRVPHLIVDPLDDARVQAFLAEHRPEQADEIWTALVERGQLDLVRTPFFLRLLSDEAARSGRVPEGPAALITAMVRSALKREVERANPAFDPGPLVAERDYWRVLQARDWRSPYELPARGRLFPTLADLAFDMQDVRLSGEAAQVCLPYDEACDRLASPRSARAAGADGENVASVANTADDVDDVDDVDDANIANVSEDTDDADDADDADRATPDAILRAAEALGVLDDDAGADEVRFVHQRLQEYFAARRLAGSPDGRRVLAAWRADDVEPRLTDLLPTMPPGETLPALPQTGWEETALLAAAMADDVPAFVADVLAANPVVAGRCAALPEVRRRLPEALLGDVRRSLVARSRDAAADVRARIDAALALGPLGDPRLERRTGPFGDYLVPPMVELPGGPATLGSDAAWGFLGVPSTRHAPEHVAVLAPYALGQYPVTNAEYACFVAAGGYDDPRWWPTAAAEAWRDGSNTAAGRRAEMLAIWDNFAADPSVLEELYETGRMRKSAYENWRGHIQLTRDAFKDHLATRILDQRWTLPKGWQSPRGDPPLHPVTGISWFEAVAYCRWLSAQMDVPYRLPTEAEVEAALRRRETELPRFDAYGMPWHNLGWAHIGGKSPIAVFPCSDTADGLGDPMGNVMIWTSTLWGRTLTECDWPYPYDAHDGREALDAPPELLRVIRGSFFAGDLCVWERHGTQQGFREDSVGLRLAR